MPALVLSDQVNAGSLRFGTRRLSGRVASSSCANEFGYDTLAVNGRSARRSAGFPRMTKLLAIGLLNAMGQSVSARLLLHLQIALFLLRLLVNVLRTMSRGCAWAKTELG